MSPAPRILCAVSELQGVSLMLFPRHRGWLVFPFPSFVPPLGGGSFVPPLGGGSFCRSRRPEGRIARFLSVLPSIAGRCCEAVPRICGSLSELQGVSLMRVPRHRGWLVFPLPSFVPPLAFRASPRVFPLPSFVVCNPSFGSYVVALLAVASMLGLGAPLPYGRAPASAAPSPRRSATKQQNRHHGGLREGSTALDLNHNGDGRELHPHPTPHLPHNKRN